MRALFPDFFNKTNARFVGRSFPLALRGEGYAVNFENRYRQSRGLGIRYTYDPSLPDACCDLVFLANVYKEIDERVAWLRRLRRALRPGGRVAIIGFHPDAAGFGPPREVRLPPRTVEAELHASGFALHQSFDFLPRQYFLVFVPR